MNTSRRRVLTTGAAALVAAVAMALTWAGCDRGDDRMRIELLTEHVGEGIVAGSRVQVDGVTVGAVDDITRAGPGRQRLTVVLDMARIPALTDQLALDYAPANLFGISDIKLIRHPGGADLSPGSVVDLTRSQAYRVHDATMGALLRSLGEVLPSVLTPQLTELLAKVAADVSAFTPILEAMVTTARIAAETQRMPSSVLLGNYATALAGMPSLIEGSVVLLNNFNHIQVLRTDRALFDSAVNLIADQLFPAIGTTGNVTRQYFAAYTDMLAPLFAAIAHTVPDPHRSGTELRQLLDSIPQAFETSPTGPVLDLEVTLRGVPGLAQPLLGAAALPVPGRPR